MAAAFAAADLALAPSIEPEAFGRISIEAQAMGCPIIVSDIGALPETLIAASNGVADTGATGWTFPPGNADALAARISAALLRDAGEQAVMAEAARKHVAASFSKHALQRRTLEVYDDLLDSSMAADFGRKSSHDVVSRSWLHRIPT
jgi:glycosyltransferase involved in cell wall biosynthesis